MTLIVGLHCGDHLLLSADSGVYDDELDAVIETPKLECGGPFAWGFSGYEPLGREFHVWMQTECARLKGLGNELDLLKEVQVVSDRINHQRWQELQAAGVLQTTLKYDHFGHVIVAGYPASGAGLMIRLVHGEHPQIEARPGLPMMLGAEDMAQKAYAALRHDSTWTPDQDGLQRLMDLAIRFGSEDWNLRQPVRILRITRDGAEDVSQEGFWRRFPWYSDRLPPTGER